MTRRRGAQPHNTNALKHGLYAGPRGLLPAPPLDPHQPGPPSAAPGDALPAASGLQPEIASFRLHIARLEALLRTEPDAEKYALYFRILCEGYNTLSRMLRIQHYLLPPQASAAEQLLLQALEEISRELGPLEPDAAASRPPSLPGFPSTPP